MITLWAVFGCPGGPQNQPKIDPWPQKGRQEAIVYRFFSRTAFVSLLGLIFHRFLMIFWLTKRCILPKPRTIFSTWRWPKSMHRRSVLSTFCFFTFFEICKKRRKTPGKTGDQKKHRKIGPRKSQNWPKMAHNSSKIRQKSQKTTKKHENWRVDFLPFFRVAKKSKTEARPSLEKWVLLGPGPSGGL